MNFRKMLSIIMVGVLCLTFFNGCGEDKNSSVYDTSTTTEAITSAEKTITLICGNEPIGFYENLKKGGEAAAKKYGFTLELMGVDDSEPDNSASYKKKLEDALNSGTSGVIITPMGTGYSDVLSRFYDEQLPVVQIDSIEEADIEKLESNHKNPIAATVITDYNQAGSLCAEKLFEAIKDDMKKSQSTFVIGVIERRDNDIDEKKAKGFIEKLSELADGDEELKDKYKIETESDDDYSSVLDSLVEENVKAVFITHSEIADEISDAVALEKEKYKDIIFCGFDSGAKQLKWLESDDGGKFIGGVAQDVVNLGYNAVEQCVFAVQGKELKRFIEIKGHWYDKSNADKMKQDKFIFEK